jgi:hypothetical protein
MAEVFISYQHDDVDRIKTIADALTALGVDVWYDPALRGGDRFEDVIKRQLGDAQAVLVCWSPTSVESYWVKSEAGRALKRGVLTPCILEPCELPIALDQIHAEDISSWKGEPDHPGWRRTIESIARLIDRPGLPQLLEANASADNLRLLVWARSFPQDPKAKEIFQRVAQAERGQFEKDLEGVRANLSEEARLWEERAHDKLRDCAATFENWVSQIETASYGDRPSAANALEVFQNAPRSQATRELEAQRDKAKEKAQHFEAAHARALADIQMLSARAAPSGKWGPALAAAVVAAAAGFGGFYFGGERSAAQIGALTGKADQAEQDLRGVDAQLSPFSISRNNLGKEIENLRLEAGKLASCEQSAAEQARNTQKVATESYDRALLRLSENSKAQVKEAKDQATEAKEREFASKADADKCRIKLSALENRPPPPPKPPANPPPVPPQAAPLPPTVRPHGGSFEGWLSGLGYKIDPSRGSMSKTCSITVRDQTQLNEMRCTMVFLIGERRFAVYTGEPGAPKYKAVWRFTGPREIEAQWSAPDGAAAENLHNLTWSGKCGKSLDGATSICAFGN